MLLPCPPRALKSCQEEAVHQGWLVRASERALPEPKCTDLVVLDSEPKAFLFGQWRNVTILVWAAEATPETVARLRRALTARVIPASTAYSTARVEIDPKELREVVQDALAVLGVSCP
jgi:hypothetical protein